MYKTTVFYCLTVNINPPTKNIKIRIIRGRNKASTLGGGERVVQAHRSSSASTLSSFLSNKVIERVIHHRDGGGGGSPSGREPGTCRMETRPIPPARGTCQQAPLIQQRAQREPPGLGLLGCRPPAPPVPALTARPRRPRGAAGAGAGALTTGPPGPARPHRPG